MKRFALALVVTLGLAVPAFAAPAPKDPMDELSGDPKSPQRHLIPPGAHEPFIEESDGTILVGYVVDMPKDKIVAFLTSELKKEGFRITITTELPTGAIYNLEGLKHGDGSITLSNEKARIRILLSLTP